MDGQSRLEAARLAAAGIVTACGEALPPSLHVPLEVLHADLEPLDQRAYAGRHALDGPTELEPEWSALVRRVCPDHETVLPAVADLTPDARAAARYRRCGLERYDLIDPDELVDAPDSGLYVWAVHQFLLDQGIAPSQSVALSRPLFDLWRFAGMPYVPPPEMTLPLGTEGAGRPLRLDDLLIEITDDESRIRTVEREVWTTRQVILPPSTSLAQTLREELADLGFAHASAGEQDGPVAVLVTDGELPYTALTDVVRNLGETDVRWIGVLTQRSPFEHQVIDVGPMRPRESPWGQTLHVDVSDQGIEVRHHHGGGPTRQFARGSNGELRYEELVQFSRAAGSDEPIAYVRGSANTPLHEIVRTVAAVRGPGCRDGGQDGCSYARVILLPPT